MRLIGLGGLLLVWTILGMGCSATPITATDRVACEAFKPISFSASQDSELTIRQVREFNAAWRAVCESDQ